MKHVLTTLILALTFFVSSSNSQVPRYITHQGLLTNASGAPFDTTINMTFKLFTALTGGTAQYTQTINNVAVSNGVFDATIGPLSLAFDKQYYLEVEAGSDVLSPRNQLTSAAYSLGPWTTSGNDLYYSLGNVAIGSTGTSGYKAYVNGSLYSTSLSTGAITASSLSLSTFSASTVTASSSMTAPVFYASSNHLFKYGQTPTLAGAAGFDFNTVSSSNAVILENGEQEGSGFYGDGDLAVIWSPGDQGLLKVYDEDGMVLRWQLDGSGNASTVSDARLKENVSPLLNALDKVTRLRGVDYNYKHTTEEQTKIASGNMKAEKTKSLGFIAQELEQIVPEAVTTDDRSGYKSVSYDMIIPLLVEAIKEQQKEIKELRALIEKK